jgi:hypothetical protein
VYVFHPVPVSPLTTALPAGTVLLVVHTYNDRSVPVAAATFQYRSWVIRPAAAHTTS